MRYIGLDLGAKTLGVSLSDNTGLIASFYKNIRYENEDELILEIDKIIIKRHKTKKAAIHRSMVAFFMNRD